MVLSKEIFPMRNLIFCFNCHKDSLLQSSLGGDSWAFYFLICREKKMKKILVVFSIFCLGFMFSPLSAMAYEGEFIIANGAEPQGIDPALIEGVPEHQIYMALFEGLTTYDPKTADPIPGLAKSWVVSNGGKTYTFKLRNAKWNDGVPITAQTVVESWLRFLDPATAAPYAWFPNMFIAGAEDYNGGKAGKEAVGIRALDRMTFQMDLIGPLPYVLGALPHYSFAVVPMHVIKKYGKNWTKTENFVSNGPFKLEKWLPQDKLTVVPNKMYWDATSVSLARIVYLASDDNNTNHNMYLNGEVDWNREIPLDQVEAAQLRDDYQTGPYLGTYYYVVNNKRAPFDDVRVRKALDMSFDKAVLCEQVAKAGQIPATAMVPKMAGYEPTPGHPYNIEMAKKLLAEAGYPNGRGFPEFKILYNTSEGHKKIAEYIQQEWSENLNINVSLINQEWKTYLNTRREHDFEVARAGWIGDYQDPNTFLDMFLAGGAMNGGQYDNPEYDRLIKKAAMMEAGPGRMAVLRQAEDHFITNDAGVIPIYTYVTKNMIDRGKWGGWHNNTMDYHPPKNLFKK
jgi:oligopeptide transport system substrate-binding protein